jgi:acylphosphatase
MDQPQRAVERREICFSGRVQGVGFRYTTREIAARYRVEGFVRNLSDGRVQLVVEGDPPELDAFVQAVEEEMERYISHRDLSTLAATGEFERFDVRR